MPDWRYLARSTPRLRPCLARSNRQSSPYSISTATACFDTLCLSESAFTTARTWSRRCFFSLFNHLQLGRSRANLRGWVFRVAHNLALRHRHRVQRQRAKSATREDPVENQLDPTANPEEQFARNQHHKRLLLVVAALSEQDQNCLRLRAEGLRYREIAQVLDMSLGAVSNSLARSMQRLLRADGR